MAKTRGAQRPKKPDNSYQQRLLSRLVKASKPLANITKDVARASGAWASEAREHLKTLDDALTNISAQIMLIPEGYAPPRTGVREPLKVGETVRIHEKQRERYKPMLEGVEFGVTAIGTVKTAGESLVEVVFGEGDKARAAYITARHLVRASV